MNVCILKLIYFDRIDASEGINVNITIVSKECDIFHYWYFSAKDFLSFNEMSAIDGMIYQCIYEA